MGLICQIMSYKISYWLQWVVYTIIYVICFIFHQIIYLVKACIIYQIMSYMQSNTLLIKVGHICYHMCHLTSYISSNVTSLKRALYAIYQLGFYIRFLMQSDVMSSNKSRYPIKIGFICHLMSYMPLNTVYQ